MQPYTKGKDYTTSCRCYDCRHKPKVIRRMARKGARQNAQKEIERSLTELR